MLPCCFARFLPSTELPGNLEMSSEGFHLASSRESVINEETKSCFAQIALLEKLDVMTAELVAVNAELVVVKQQSTAQSAAMNAELVAVKQRLTEVEGLVKVGACAAGRTCKDAVKDYVRSHFPEQFPKVPQAQQPSFAAMLLKIAESDDGLKTMKEALTKIGIMKMRHLLVTFNLLKNEKCVSLLNQIDEDGECLSPIAADDAEACDIILSTPIESRRTVGEEPGSRPSSTKANALVHHMPCTEEARIALVNMRDSGVKAVLGSMAKIDDMKVIMKAGRNAHRIQRAKEEVIEYMV
ncbi:hypothetical protein CEUSTIGMA_g11249.t1 [Chlamydomonas eustigma]|uniref:Uncharacterized protein n=1 Tax=Chlamydomonas eustigma TaxID=1157962 RepID=A0A250XL47_9CHLO|nr:hypothetical protein CEUSTIGMA_g11249.t1 [Chlamydomonas eustigma]|eukprot:GAX83825.1 hypothetical protein CEUSTIGMA_g11249.t1 [Chlamydomonas eustigma]